MRVDLRRAAGPIVCAVVALGALYLLASALTARELRREARTERAAYAAGVSPWQWSLRQPDDVVAGRAFGQATLVAGDDGLQARSLDGSAYEVGLPLARDADLRRTPRLRLALSTTQPLRLWLVVRQTLQGPLCAAAATLPANGVAIWQLDALAWQRPDGQACATPVRAALLRLRVQQDAGSIAGFDTAALLPRTDARPADADAVIALPADPVAAKRLLESAPTRTAVATLPQVRLPARVSPQRLLALRDLAHAVLPAAIVWPAGVAPAGSADASASIAVTSPAWAWSGLLAYALALLWLAVWPPRGPWRPWLEVGGCMAGPLWLIAGLHLQLHTAPVDLAAFALALAFATALELRMRPANWRWLGPARDWLAPLAVLPVAAILLALFAHDWQWPRPPHVALYLAWAALQQWLMLAVVGRRLQAAVPVAGMAGILTALLFALLHVPNAPLMLLCFVAELWWAECFRRGRALLPVTLAHAGAALLLQAGLSGDWLRSLEVSARYFL